MSDSDPGESWATKKAIYDHHSRAAKRMRVLMDIDLLDSRFEKEEMKAIEIATQMLRDIGIRV